MTKDSDSSTHSQAERGAKLARLREAARRAVWDATEGPLHLRAGRCWIGHADDEMEETSDRPPDDGYEAKP